MADTEKTVARNAAGEFFVDTTCIDCDACRQLAPVTFGDDGEKILKPADEMRRDLEKPVETMREAP